MILGKSTEAKIALNENGSFRERYGFFEKKNEVVKYEKVDSSESHSAAGMKVTF